MTFSISCAAVQAGKAAAMARVMASGFNMGFPLDGNKTDERIPAGLVAGARGGKN
jgi:hypothetical protein